MLLLVALGKIQVSVSVQWETMQTSIPCKKRGKYTRVNIDRVSIKIRIKTVCSLVHTPNSVCFRQHTCLQGINQYKK